MKPAWLIPAGLLAAGLLGCSGPRADNPVPRGVGDRGEVFQVDRQAPPEIQRVLDALRRGDSAAAHSALARLEKEKPRAFEDWMAKELPRGRTARRQVLALFGGHFRDLDRPKRDGVVTIQYDLGDQADLIALVFDFDAQTHRLSDWSVSRAICGFCPHVFAYDGRWRLEGKLLAGCVGPRREGSDALLLPRLAGRQGRLRVRVSNLAPEVEYIDQVRLGSVPLRGKEELDVDADGRLMVWHPTRQVECRGQPAPAGREGLVAHLGTVPAGRVLVLEVRNTSAFEAAMRASLLPPAGRPPAAALEVRFDGRAAVAVRPVGTKFLRRVVVPVPRGSRSLSLGAPAGWWLVRRCWVGPGRPANGVVWQPPARVAGPGPEARRLLLHADGRRVRLGPTQEMELLFPEPRLPEQASRWGHVLRMAGYYEFEASRTLPEGKAAHR